MSSVPRVTACNLAAVPLLKASLNVAVFCLALMGTDWTKFVAEVQKWRWGWDQESNGKNNLTAI
jgi:ribosomal RNA-processing protein 8